MRNVFAKKEKSIATGIVKPKTTALFFDKIWIPDFKDIIFDDQIPDSLLYKLDKFALCKSHMDKFGSCIQKNRPYEYKGEPFDWLCVKNSGANLSDIFNEQEILYEDMKFKTSYHRNKGLKDFVNDMKNNYNVDITPIYIDKTSFEKDFFDYNDKLFENSNPITIAMEHIPSVIEEKLSWEQVLDFKKDKKSSKKLRNFRCWAERDLYNCTKTQIIHIYEHALDEYKQALKKHGILTTIGALSIIFNSSATIVDKIDSDFHSRLAAGITITTGLTVFTLKQAYDYYEAKNKPIAYVCDVLKIEDFN